MKIEDLFQICKLTSQEIDLLNRYVLTELDRKISNSTEVGDALNPIWLAAKSILDNKMMTVIRDHHKKTFVDKTVEGQATLLSEFVLNYFVTQKSLSLGNPIFKIAQTEWENKSLENITLTNILDRFPLADSSHLPEGNPEILYLSFRYRMKEYYEEVKQLRTRAANQADTLSTTTIQKINNLIKHEKEILTHLDKIDLTHFRQLSPDVSPNIIEKVRGFTRNFQVAACYLLDYHK